VEPHPAFADRAIPARLRLGPFHLRGLGPEDLDEDLAALRESEAALIGLFDDGTAWPEGITREENLVDLCWHRREFEAQRSFAWVIADARDDAYLGCAYVYPAFAAEARAKVVWWFRSAAEEALAERFPRLFLDWLAEAPWPPMAIVSVHGLPPAP